MKVAMYYNNNDIRIEEYPKPQMKDNEILVKVHSCGICGSDVVEWYRMPKAPLVQGHEVSGEIVEVGSSVSKFKIGDRVMVAPKVGCGECKYCLQGNSSVCPNVKVRLPGVYAEFVLVPSELVEKAVFSIPDDLSFDAATFVEPLACAVRAQKFSDVKKGDRVLVIGSGMSGLLHVKLALHNGIDVTAMDINESRLKFAEKLGAKTINVKDEIKEKFDVVILCTASLSAFENAWKSVDIGGVVVLFTVPSPDKKVVVPVNDFWRKEIRVITSYYCGPSDLEESLELISSDKIKVEDMITHKLPLDEIQKGFNLVLDGKDSLKVIIKP